MHEHVPHPGRGNGKFSPSPMDLPRGAKGRSSVFRPQPHPVAGSPLGPMAAPPSLLVAQPVTVAVSHSLLKAANDSELWEGNRASRLAMAVHHTIVTVSGSTVTNCPRDSLLAQSDWANNNTPLSPAVCEGILAEIAKDAAAHDVPR